MGVLVGLCEIMPCKIDLCIVILIFLPIESHWDSCASGQLSECTQGPLCKLRVRTCYISILSEPDQTFNSVLEEIQGVDVDDRQYRYSDVLRYSLGNTITGI